MITCQDSGETYPTIWDAIEEDPAVAANMRIRFELMIAIELRVKSWNLSQSDAAERIGISQPRLNDLLRGRIGRFSMDSLVKVATNAGIGVNLEFKDAA